MGRFRMAADLSSSHSSPTRNAVLDDPAMDCQVERRFFDPAEQRWLINVPAESFYVTADDEVLFTTLGSCVSACVYDPTRGLGGLNHFLLPQKPPGMDPRQALRYGCHSMVQLLDALEAMGASHSTLETKVFGGGGTAAFGSDVGRSNIDFVMEYLSAVGIPVVAQDVGGPWARQVRFYPTTGLVRVRRLELIRRVEIVERERRLFLRLSVPPSGDVE